MVLREIKALFRGQAEATAARRNREITANIAKTHLPARTERINQTLQIGQSLQVTDGGRVPFSINYLTEGTMAILYSNGRGFANCELPDGGFVEVRGMVVTRSGDSVSLFGVTNLQNGSVSEQIGQDGFLFVRDSGGNLYGINNTTVFLYNRESQTGIAAVAQWSNLELGENLLGNIRVNSAGNGRVTMEDNSPTPTSSHNATMIQGSRPLLPTLGDINLDSSGFESVEGIIYLGAEGYGTATLRYRGQNHSLTSLRDGSWGFDMGITIIRRKDQTEPINFPPFRIERTGEHQFRILRTESDEDVRARVQAKLAERNAARTETTKPVTNSYPMLELNSDGGKRIIEQCLEMICNPSAEFRGYVEGQYRVAGGYYITLRVDLKRQEVLGFSKDGDGTQIHFTFNSEGRMIGIQNLRAPHLQRVTQAIQARYNAAIDEADQNQTIAYGSGDYQ